MRTVFSGSRLDWLLRLLLVASVALVYWPVLHAGFVHWDDGLNITDNPHLSLTWENLRWMFTDASYARRYLPLGWLSYTPDRILFGGTARSYHAGNLLLHACNTLLLYAILKQLLIGKSQQNFSGLQIAAAAGALWWAVNPMRVEAVAWASARIYCAAAFFFFLALWLYLRQANAPEPERGHSVVRWAALSFGISLFTYPVALGGLALFVVLDVLPLERLPVKPAEWSLPKYRPVWAEKLWFLAPALIMLSANFLARFNHPEVDSLVTLAQFGLNARVMQAFWVWAWYLWKPWEPLDLAPKYPDLLGDVFSPAHLAAAALVGGITILLFLRRKIWPAALGAWICHVALLLPLSGFTEHPHFTTDRYSYIVSGLWACGISAGVLLCLRRELPLWAPAAGVAGLCGLLGWLAQQQTLIWNNSLNLQTRMAESLRNNPQRALHDTAAARFLLDANRPAEAAVTLRQALALKPDLPEAWGAFGDALSAQNQTEQAIASYKRALELKRELHSARQNLAVTLATAGRPEEALVQFSELLRLQPSNASAHYNLALTLNRLGRKEEARVHYEEFKRRQAESDPRRKEMGLR